MFFELKFSFLLSLGCNTVEKMLTWRFHVIVDDNCGVWEFWDCFEVLGL